MNSVPRTNAIVRSDEIYCVMLIPTAITNAAPMSMCSSSFRLNLSPFLGIIGAYVTVC